MVCNKSLTGQTVFSAVTEENPRLGDLRSAFFVVNLIELASQIKEGEDYCPIKRKRCF